MKAYSQLGKILFLLLTVSCSQMFTHRDYLTEMEHDDSTFYSPNEDFPVVAGDTGRVWESETTRRSRTPASESDIQESQGRNLLQRELRQLESKQSESSYALYDKYKAKLGTTSERIYFLKLPQHERKDYLMSRGFISTESITMRKADQMGSRRPSSVMLGMNKDDVMNSLGRPSRVEVAGNPSFENERWLYSHNGASKYIYFESGRVEGWE
jgi:hypothetical protein